MFHCFFFTDLAFSAGSVAIRLKGINKLFAELHIEKGEKKEALAHLKAIHHKDQEITDKIQDLEYDNSLVGRIWKIFQRK